MSAERSESTGGSRGRLGEPYASLLEKLLAEASKRLGNDLVSLVVFGSAARGEARPDSDTDLLIVELLLKASLRLAGIEPPKWHDAGPLLPSSTRV
ncbi:MAG: nucleotidyltransferase domain-containing protein [Acidilobaceae archaeon]